MHESTLSSKGQVTVPKAIRELLRVEAGDKLRFVVAPDGSVRVRGVSGDLAALGKILPPPRRRASIEDFDRAIRGRLAARAAR